MTARKTIRRTGRAADDTWTKRASGGDTWTRLTRT